MKNLICIITNYLNKEAICRKDVIVISVLSSFIVLIIKDSFIKIKKFIIKVINMKVQKIKDLWRRYIKGNLSYKEIIEIEKKLETGEKFKWYEKKGYNKYLEEVKKISEEIKKRGIANKTSFYSMLDTVNEYKDMIKKR